MNISMNSLELMRTDVAHIGTSPLAGEHVNKNSRQDESSKGVFESYLLEAVEKMNQQQLDVSNMQQQIVMDPDSIDIHDVTTAMAKAQMSLNLAQTVIDRVISGWNELSTNR